MTAGMKRVSVSDLQRMHRKGQPITMITAYDYPTARLADEAGIPVILVGDSLGMVVLGYDSTLPVTVEDMIHHGSAVMRGAERAHVVVDMPFGSYQAGWKSAMRNASRIMQETSCSAVKLEGGQRSAEIVKRLVDAGIPVMGHVGLTPQSVNAMAATRSRVAPRATPYVCSATRRPSRRPAPTRSCSRSCPPPSPGGSRSG